MVIIVVAVLIVAHDLIKTITNCVLFCFQPGATASTNIVAEAMEQLNASTEEISALATELVEIIAYFHE